MPAHVPRLPDLPSGTYEHYKGGKYLVLGYGHDSNHDERVVVVYVPLYSAEGPRLAVRDASEFFDWVHPEDDGKRCSNGGRCGDAVRRFTYLSQGSQW